MEGVELYRPSNGTEGDIFMDHYCHLCARLDVDGEPCPILGASLSMYPDEDGYPREWRYIDGQPTCVLFCNELPTVPRCPETVDMFEPGASA